MGSKTDQFEIDLLKCVSGQSTAGVFGSNVLSTYFGYFTTIPSDSSNGVEASHGGYGRVAVTGTMSTPSAGSMTNTGTVTHPANTDLTAVTVTGWGIWSASTSGTLLYWSDLRDAANSITTKSIGNGDSMSYPPGSITVTED